MRWQRDERGPMMTRSDKLTTLEAARRWMFLFSVLFFVTGLIMTGMLTMFCLYAAVQGAYTHARDD